VWVKVDENAIFVEDICDYLVLCEDVLELICVGEVENEQLLD